MCIHLVASIDFINDQNWVIWDYTDMLKIKTHIKFDIWNVIIFTFIQEVVVKFGVSKIVFVRKRIFISWKLLMKNYADYF